MTNSQTRAQLLIAAVLLLSYTYVLPRWADWSQNSRLDLARALSEQQSVIIDDYVANTGDYALYRGHAYSDKAPGPVFLALPAALALRPALDLPATQAYAARLANRGALAGTLNPAGSGLNADKLRAFALQAVLTLLAIALPCALGALALLGLLRHLGAPAGLAGLLTLAYGLASGVAPYAGNFYSHALVAALLAGAWAVAARPYAPARALLAGLLLGWALISEYPAALAALPIGLAAAWGWRRPGAVGWAALGGLGPVLLLALYDWRAFGTPLPVGYEHSALWQSQHQSGFLSITYPRPEAIWGLTFGLYRGMFVRAPWLLLALPGYVLWWRARRERAWWWVALLAPLGLLVFYGSSVMWWGGFAAGARYLALAVPFLAVASAPAAAWLWHARWGRAALLLLIACSLALTWAEALAGQGFPPDTIANPWTGYTLPAWRAGDLARSAGAALGLRGAAALLPLVLLMGGALIALAGRTNRSPGASPPAGVEGASVAQIQP
jgi:hypothetical protein